MALGRAKHNRGRKAAKDLLERLDGNAFRERAQFTEEEMRVLERIASGKYVRNAAAIERVFRFRAEYAYAKPRQGFDATISRDPRDVSDEEWAALAALRHQVRAAEPTPAPTPIDDAEPALREDDDGP